MTLLLTARDVFLCGLVLLVATQIWLTVARRH
jgi:hypothetical protein